MRRQPPVWTIALLQDLAATASDGTAPLVIELKFGAGLTANQQVNYLRQLPEGQPGALLLWDGRTSAVLQAARVYTWCRPPSTGNASTAPVEERAAGWGVSRCRVRCGRSLL